MDYTEFFYQAGIILKEKGNIVLLVKKLDHIAEIADKRGFEIKETHEMMMGKDKENIVILKKVIPAQP